MSRSVKNKCLLCEEKIRENQKAVYCVNCETDHSWRDKEELQVLFLNSKNPKNLVCYGCWDKIIRTFGKTKQEEKAIIKKDRLKSVE